MTQVDFYILSDETAEARLRFICRLLNKLQKLDKRVFIAADSPRQAELLDSLLWRHPPESFLPHSLLDAGDIDSEPATVGISSQVRDIAATVYINLRPVPPQDCSTIERLVEVVSQEAEVLANTRRNFKFYRDQGYPIQSHKLSNQH